MLENLQWDVFCKVIDNHGDIGFCWRLCADLAAHGQHVRLWANDASALGWMAPHKTLSIQVLPYPNANDQARVQAVLAQRMSDVVVETFGCEIAPEFIAQCAYLSSISGKNPLWINLEYLSAESYVERCHAKPSPVLQGAAQGWHKWFFYPGFTPATGGLLREKNLTQRQAAFDPVQWRKKNGLPAQGRFVSLFCYEPAALQGLLRQWSRQGMDGATVHLLVSAGRAAKAVAEVTELCPQEDGLLNIVYLPWLSQIDFDHLLWACDLNFVRGEDSLVRALWAGKPWVWQIYPQDDQAHVAKLQAFLTTMQAPADLQDLHTLWNAAQAPSNATPAYNITAEKLTRWQLHAQTVRARLQQQEDLATQLLQFAYKNR